jgi:hypothetical protein
MQQRPRMAYYANLLHPTPGAIGADACTQDEALAALVLACGCQLLGRLMRPPCTHESAHQVDLVAGRLCQRPG